MRLPVSVPSVFVALQAAGMIQSESGAFTLMFAQVRMMLKKNTQPQITNPKLKMIFSPCFRYE